LDWGQLECTYGPAAGNAFAVVIFFISLAIVTGVIENWRVIDGRATMLMGLKRFFICL
jgi:hypothetical protein